MDIEHKRVEFDNASDGTIGLESAFGMLNQIFDLDTTISLLTKGRERYGIETPVLKVGENAALTLFDPDQEYTFEEEDILSNSKNSCFVGSKLKGKVYGIVSNNQIIN